MQYTIDQPHFQTVAVYSIIKKWLSRRCEDEIAEFLRIKMEQNKQNILLDEFSLLSGC